MKCTDKVVVVTGAGSGMGRELILELLRRKARVAAVDRNESALYETVQLAGAPPGALASFALDITHRADVDGLPRKVEGALGGRRRHQLRRRHPAVHSPRRPRLRGHRSRLRRQFSRDALHDESILALVARASRGAHRQHLEHGWVRARALYRVNPVRATAFIAKMMKELLPRADGNV